MTEMNEEELSNHTNYLLVVLKFLYKSGQLNS